MLKIVLFLFTCIYANPVFEQEVISEEIAIKNGDFRLPGTLSYTKSKSPLIIWIHGSGPSDRHGNQSQFIKQFRDEINKNHIAFFSYDKRTATASNIELIKEKGIVIDDLIDDVKQVVNHFKDDERFSEIILVGHSQGALLGLMALEHVDKYISLSGTAETIDRTIVKQVIAQNAELGEIAKKQLAELKETKEIKQVNPFLMSLLAKQNQAFLWTWMQLNPTEIIKHIEIPLLILNGDKDLQVPIDNAKKLYEVSPNAELVIIKNMNHVLKHIEKEEDNMKSYYNPNVPISKELIKIITEFINKS